MFMVRNLSLSRLARRPNSAFVCFLWAVPVLEGFALTFCFASEPQWGGWTTVTGCIKTNEGSCVSFRTRSCNTTEAKSCLGSHVDTSPCPCPKGKNDIVSLSMKFCIDTASPQATEKN